MARGNGQVAKATRQLGHLALAVAIIAQRQHSALAAQQQRVLLAAGNRDEEGVAGQVTLTVEVPTNTNSLAIVAQQHAVAPSGCDGHVFHVVPGGLPEKVWHIALAIAILSAALHLSIARQGQRVAVPGGHGHHGALLRQLALAAAVTTEGPAVTSVVQHERMESPSSHCHNWSRQRRHIGLSIQVQTEGFDNTIAAQEQTVLRASCHRHISQILLQRRAAGFTLTIQADGYDPTLLQQQRVVPTCTESPLRQQRSGSGQVARQRGVQEFLQGLLQHRLCQLCCRSQTGQELQVVHCRDPSLDLL
mmetsp:Transcript_17829/g.30167  ORF Transcript_17829/g.30167 Transcript_17829/m.30167 type:complete len:305 (+) Transcript_17829:477-1391(+)